jgi:MFS family permease
MKIQNESIHEKLKRYQTMKNQSTGRIYMAVLILIISVVHMLDSFATALPNSLQTAVVSEFFVFGRGMEYQDGLALMGTYGMVFIIVAVIAPFYKSLADRFGRKPIFVISVFGMGFGMLLCYLAQTVFIFLLGRAIITFFIAADIQVVYILEVAPEKKRGTFFSITKFAGVVGLILIPALRTVFMADDSSNWRPVFLIPAIIGIIIATAILFIVRESKIYLDKQIEILTAQASSESLEIKDNKEINTKEKPQKGGFKKALKYCFRSKQPRALLLAVLFYYLAIMPFSGYFESIMSTSGMTPDKVNVALFFYPFTYAIVTFFGGFIADKIGRKKLSGMSCILAFIAFIGFNVSAFMSLSPWVVGILFGFAIGAYWTSGDFLSIMLAESVPTDIRSSTMAAYGLVCTIAGTLSAILMIIGMRFFSLGIISTIIGAIMMGIAMVIMNLKVKETKDVVLSDVGVTEI